MRFSSDIKYWRNIHINFRAINFTTITENGSTKQLNICCKLKLNSNFDWHARKNVNIVVIIRRS